MTFLALKKVGSYFGANIYVGEQKLETYVRRSFTVVNLHDSWSNYHRSIWNVMG